MGVASRSSTEAIGYSFPIIGFVLVAARFASRWHRRAPVRLDDWLCIPAWLFVTAACTTLLVGLYHGAFYVESEAPEATEEQAHLLAQILAAFVVFYTFANATIKFSILCFYRRIFVGRLFSIFNWVLIVATGVWLIFGLLAWILYCGTHVRDNFEGPWLTCPMWGVYIEMAAFASDSFIDFCIIILPIPSVCRLQTTVSRRIMLVLLFCLGGFAFVAGLNNTVVQLIYVTHPYETGLEGAPPDLNQGGDLLLTNWPCIEIGVGLIACNLPSISLTSTKMLSGWLIAGWRSISSRGSRSQTERHGSIEPDVPKSHGEASTTPSEVTDDVTIELGHMPKK